VALELRWQTPASSRFPSVRLKAGLEIVRGYSRRTRRIGGMATSACALRRHDRCLEMSVGIQRRRMIETRKLVIVSEEAFLIDARRAPFAQLDPSMIAPYLTRQQGRKRAPAGRRRAVKSLSGLRGCRKIAGHQGPPLTVTPQTSMDRKTLVHVSMRVRRHANLRQIDTSRASTVFISGSVCS
jgi:hypothetical protein